MFTNVFHPAFRTSREERNMVNHFTTLAFPKLSKLKEGIVDPIAESKKEIISLFKRK